MQTFFFVLIVVLVGLLYEEIDKPHYLYRIVSALSVFKLEANFSVSNRDDIKLHRSCIVSVWYDLLETDVGGIYFGLGILFAQKFENFYRLFIYQ